MQTKQILELYLEFYKSRGHKQIPNVSLVPEGDPTLLFVNSGMFPLVPYLSGEPHPLGSRLVNVQRAIRLDDINEIGDKTHTFAFHMIGNWSLNDYFKKEQLPWAYEFLIEQVKLDPKRLFATFFAGDKDSPRDENTLLLLQQIFAKYGVEAKENERLFACGKDQCWWQRGEAIGELGGPDSEVFYYIGDGEPKLGLVPGENDDLFLEVGNSVFMQYQMTESGWRELAQKNVDFGGGLERLAMVVQNKSDIFETDNFYPIIQKIEQLSQKNYRDSETITKSMRIIADHIRACVFLAMDGVMPSNKDQGYILRRLLRRMVRNGRNLGVEKDISVNLVPIVCELFEWLYPSLVQRRTEIQEVFSLEEDKFWRTLQKGSREFERLYATLDTSNLEELASKAFDMYQSLGYPVEMFLADLDDKAATVDLQAFERVYNEVAGKHQDMSRLGAEKKFKGGLADSSETVVKYHTTNHLLQMALQDVLGNHVKQVGSNITSERLRFDFTHHRKLTDEEIKKVTALVNDAIRACYPVNFVMLSKDKAIEAGAGYLEHETYPDEVKVYYVGSSLESSLSKEFCGGPHVDNTCKLQPIEIFKQEKMGEGKVRVYARFS